MAVPPRPSRNPDALKKLEQLSDQLDTARDVSEATTKEVQHARRTAEKVKRAVRLQRHSEDTKRTGKPSKGRLTKDGKSKAAVELGRKGGVARTKALTRRRRSALAAKAAKARWNSR
jgi:hypothetical protein